MGDYAGYGQDFLGTIGFIYIGVCVIALGLALWLPKGKTSKAAVALIVLAVASILPFQAFMFYRQEKQAADAFKVRYDKAKAIFDERCKSAGLKIYKTIEGVDSLYLINIHERVGTSSDPMTLSAASWHISDGEWYVRDLLFDEEVAPNNPYGYSPSQRATGRPGFKFVEAIDPKDGERYRYTWRPGEDMKRERSPASKAPRYAIETKDYLIPEDRAHWIASSSLKITDTQTSETMADMLYYKFEAGLGSQDGARQPWSFAVSCPNAPVMDSMHRFIANKILRSETQVKK